MPKKKYPHQDHKDRSISPVLDEIAMSKKQIIATAALAGTGALFDLASRSLFGAAALAAVAQNPVPVVAYAATWIAGQVGDFAASQIAIRGGLNTHQNLVSKTAKKLLRTMSPSSTTTDEEALLATHDQPELIEDSVMNTIRVTFINLVSLGGAFLLPVLLPILPIAGLTAGWGLSLLMLAPLTAALGVGIYAATCESNLFDAERAGKLSKLKMLRNLTQSVAPHIRSYGAEEQFDKKIDDAIDAHITARRATKTWRTWVWYIRMGFIGLSQILPVGLTVLGVISPPLSALIATVLVSQLLVGPVRDLPTQAINLVRHYIAARHQSKVMREQPSIREDQNTIPLNADQLRTITLEDVTYVPPARGETSENVILENINLRFPVEKKGLRVIAGSNGTGKTTLTRLLLGQIEPTSGHLLYNGEAAEKFPIRDRRAVSAVMTQNALLTGDTVLEALQLGLHHLTAENVLTDNKQLVLTALEQADSGWFHKTLQNDPDDKKLLEFMSKPNDTLSGGERQRVALATALLRDPKVLFVDEGTSNLDPPSRNAAWRAYQAQAEKRFVVVVTHDLEHVQRNGAETIILDRQDPDDPISHATIVEHRLPHSPPGPRFQKLLDDARPHRKVRLSMKSTRARIRHHLF